MRAGDDQGVGLDAHLAAPQSADLLEAETGRRQDQQQSVAAAEYSLRPARRGDFREALARLLFRSRQTRPPVRVECAPDGFGSARGGQTAAFVHVVDRADPPPVGGRRGGVFGEEPREGGRVGGQRGEIRRSGQSANNVQSCR
ncbi:hypothetical protein [Rhodococcus sp. NPDC058481]|uniref:hypothetical protein n=1 Tax=unclassified Rhodococcus (in: high G+C Gram-positive bacteria) TaxID=192944 RepID=UPI003649DD4E